eukprot:Pgem_evm3s17184
MEVRAETQNGQVIYSTTQSQTSHTRVLFNNGETVEDGDVRTEWVIDFGGLSTINDMAKQIVFPEVSKLWFGFSLTKTSAWVASSFAQDNPSVTLYDLVCYKKDKVPGDLNIESKQWSIDPTGSMSLTSMRVINPYVQEPPVLYDYRDHKSDITKGDHSNEKSFTKIVTTTNLFGMAGLTCNVFIKSTGSYKVLDTYGIQIEATDPITAWIQINKLDDKIHNINVVLLGHITASYDAAGNNPIEVENDYIKALNNYTNIYLHHDGKYDQNDPGTNFIIISLEAYLSEKQPLPSTIEPNLQLHKGLQMVGSNVTDNTIKSETTLIVDAPRVQSDVVELNRLSARNETLYLDGDTLQMEFKPKSGVPTISTLQVGKSWAATVTPAPSIQNKPGFEFNAGVFANDLTYDFENDAFIDSSDVKSDVKVYYPKQSFVYASFPDDPLYNANNRLKFNLSTGNINSLLPGITGASWSGNLKAAVIFHQTVYVGPILKTYLPDKDDKYPIYGRSDGFPAGWPFPIGRNRYFDATLSAGETHSNWVLRDDKSIDNRGGDLDLWWNHASRLPNQKQGGYELVIGGPIGIRGKWTSLPTFYGGSVTSQGVLRVYGLTYNGFWEQTLVNEPFNKTIVKKDLSLYPFYKEKYIAFKAVLNSTKDTVTPLENIKGMIGFKGGVLKGGFVNSFGNMQFTGDTLFFHTANCIYDSDYQFGFGLNKVMLPNRADSGTCFKNRVCFGSHTFHSGCIFAGQDITIKGNLFVEGVIMCDNTDITPITDKPKKSIPKKATFAQHLTRAFKLTAPYLSPIFDALAVIVPFPANIAVTTYSQVLSTISNMLPPVRPGETQGEVEQVSDYYG